MENVQPIIITHDLILGEQIHLTISGEDWRDGRGPLDTTVKIGDKVLCCISWPQKEAFTHELMEVINRYRI